MFPNPHQSAAGILPADQTFLNLTQTRTDFLSAPEHFRNFAIRF
jgi:hypothetical protein